MNPDATTSAPPLLYWTFTVIIVVLAIVGWIVLRKGRRLPGEHVFKASRLSKGNRLFPAQVVITSTSVTLHHPQWIGRLEESIHLAHVASVKIDTNLIFSDVLIETTGGHHPIRCYGHTKGDAVRMKQLLERFQTEHYKAKPER
jgi:hypothetical protein